MRYRTGRYNEMDVRKVRATLVRMLGNGKIRTPEDVPPVLRGWLIVKGKSVVGVEKAEDICKVSHAEMQAIEKLERGEFKGGLPMAEEKHK